jgi:hypothetical protein
LLTQPTFHKVPLLSIGIHVAVMNVIHQCWHWLLRQIGLGNPLLSKQTPMLGILTVVDPSCLFGLVVFVILWSLLFGLPPLGCWVELLRMDGGVVGVYWVMMIPVEVNHHSFDNYYRQSTTTTHIVGPQKEQT